MSLIGLVLWNIVTDLQCKLCMLTNKTKKIQDAFFVQSTLSLCISLITSRLDNWNILSIKSHLISNWHYAHSPRSPFCLPRLHPSGKSRFFNSSGRNSEDSQQDLCSACCESECPVAWHNQRRKLISGSAVWGKGNAICVQACHRVHWSSNTASVLHQSD